MLHLQWIQFWVPSPPCKLNTIYNSCSGRSSILLWLHVTSHTWCSHTNSGKLTHWKENKEIFKKENTKSKFLIFTNILIFYGVILVLILKLFWLFTLQGQLNQFRKRKKIIYSLCLIGVGSRWQQFSLNFSQPTWMMFPRKLDQRRHLA